MKKRQKGSITVEATLFLPLFFLAFVSIYSLISFTRAQLIVQYAADQAAKEVAQYSYILEKIGILDSLDGLNSRSEDFEKNIKSIEEQLQTVQQAGENALNGEDPVGNTIEAGKAAKDAYGTVSGYVDDPESFISGVLAVFKKDAINGISTYMVNTVAKSCVMKQLSVAGGGQDPLTYAEKLGISDMNMSKTVWCQNKTRDIKIIVDFNMNNQVPFFQNEAETLQSLCFYTGLVRSVMKENMMETVINTTAKKKKIFFLAFLLTEVVSCFLFYRYDYHWTKILRYLCLTGFMLVLAVIDHEKSIVPNKLLVAMLVIRAVLLVIEVAVYPVYWKEKMISAVGGMLVGLILFLLAYVLSRKSIGLGDVKLAAVLGWYLGLSLIWWDLVAGLLLAGIYSVVQLARKKLSMKDSIPLVPFLATGTILILLLGF